MRNGSRSKTQPTLPPFTGSFSTSSLGYLTQPSAERNSKSASNQVDSTQRLKIEADWRKWHQAIAPKVFTAKPAWFHEEYWDYVWPIQLRRANHEVITDVPLSVLIIWGRGLGKSTSVEFTAVSEGALIEQAFGVYVSSTQDKANEHIAAVRDALEASEVARYYPGLSNPRVGKFGNQRGWRQEAVYTDNGFAIVGVGLDKGVRGLKDINQRPTLFIVDDVDERDDSPLIVEKKWKTLASDILPMAAPMAFVLFAQNLIHLTSVMTKTMKREIPLLSHRRQFGPVNAFKDDLDIQKQEHRKVIVAGTPNWDRLDVIAAQKFLDDIGEDIFRSEYQNEMLATKAERVLSEYDEVYHVITWSMFEAVFGTRKIATHWEIHYGHDWGTTGPNAHPAVLTLTAVAAQDSPLPGAAFVFYGHTAEAGSTEHQIARRLIETLPDLIWHPGAAEAKVRLKKSDEAPTEELMWQLRREAGRLLPVTTARMSHETTKSEMVTYQVKWGIPFAACDPGKLVGLSQIRHYLEPDMGRSHPFKPGVMGCPSMFFVVVDEQLYEAKDDFGLKRHRTEALTLKWDPNVAGRDVPIKRGDDAFDSLKMIFQGFKLHPTPLTHAQKVQEEIPEQYRLETLLDQSPNNVGLTPEQELTYLIQKQMAEKRVKAKSKIKRFDD